MLRSPSYAKDSFAKCLKYIKIQSDIIPDNCLYENESKKN